MTREVGGPRRPVRSSPGRRHRLSGGVNGRATSLPRHCRTSTRWPGSSPCATPASASRSSSAAAGSSRARSRRGVRAGPAAPPVVAAPRTRRAYFPDHGEAAVPVHEGDSLAPGSRLEGPLLVDRAEHDRRRAARRDVPRPSSATTFWSCDEHRGPASVRRKLGDGADRRARQPLRRDRPRDDEHAVPHRPQRRAEHGARLLLLHRDRRRPAPDRGRGAAGARPRRRAADELDDRDSTPTSPRATRSCTTTRWPATRTPPTTRCSSGVPRRPARVHGVGEGAPGRLRQRRADDVHGLRARRLRGGGADLPVRADPARLRGRRGHRADVPGADPRPGDVVRRLPRRARRRADRRAAPAGAGRALRGRHARAVRRASGSTTRSGG